MLSPLSYLSEVNPILLVGLLHVNKLLVEMVLHQNLILNLLVQLVNGLLVVLDSLILPFELDKAFLEFHLALSFAGHDHLQ